MSRRFEVTEEQWSWMEPILRPMRRTDGKGRPPADTRRVLNGVRWILGTGARWRELPPTYGPFPTVHGRFQHWVREGELEQMLRRLSKELCAQGRLKLAKAFIDATFAPAKRRLAIGPTHRGKGTKILAVADQHGLPLAPAFGSQLASSHESRLVESTLAASFLD